MSDYGKFGPVSPVPTRQKLKISPCSFVRCACAQYLGFANAELLQGKNRDRIKRNPRASPMLPRWVYSHDPEKYAYEYYDRAVASMQKGIAIEDEDVIPPNYPPGYHYSPFDVEQIMRDMEEDRYVELSPGDWS